MDVGTESSSESSQNIVDELFKDFISKKISKSKSTTSTKAKEATKPAKVDEISKLLDLEISSIQAQTTKDSSDVVKDVRNQNSAKSVSSSVSQALSTELKNANGLQKNVTAASIPLPPLPPQESINSISKIDDSAMFGPKPDVSAAVSSANATNLTTASLPTVAKPLVGILPKKLNIPKQLGCKLSTESLSLITSNDKIDRNGRTWEEGEVESSNSEESNKDSGSDDNDGYPSETGSINSDKEDWKSPQSSSSKHKKKHKHKHKKKKKKKSSKEKDKTSQESEDEKGSKKSKDKERRNKKDKEESSSNHKDKSSADRNPDEKVKENGDEKSEKSRDEKSRDEKSEKSRDEKSEKSRDEKSEKSRRRESESETSRKDKKVSDKDKDKIDDKKREKEKKRKHDRSRSRTPKRSKRSRSRSRSPRKSRRSPSPRRSRYSEWDARRYSDDPKKFSRSRSRSKSPTRSKRRRSSDKKRDRSSDKKRDKSSDRKRERSGDRKQDKSSKERDKDRDLRLQIDKAKLRKIAIANALNSMKSGQPVPVQIDMAAVKSGGKSVEELTDFCKRISEKEQEKMDNAVSDSSEEELAAPSDDEEPLIHHPFKVKEANIVMNIRNAKQLPVLTPSEKQAQQATLRLAFPVSSGTHHRASESEWVPVEKTTAQATTTPTTTTTTTTSKSVDSKATTESQPQVKESIFPTAPASVDIGAIISERLQAVRKLQANPYDVQALSSMHKAQQKASQWAQSKHLPGQFVGSTGAQVLSQQELMGDKRRQAWVRKTQFSAATPVSGGIGMFLLQKMGWKQGEGLGKNNEGNTQPLQLDIKIDRKGLQSAADNPKSRPHIPHVPQAKDLSHKHPVSALMELCNKRRWGPPNFTVVQDDGPAHKKCFLFKVKVNNVEYQPAVPSSNKKSAKAQCAAVCLQEMGLLPRDAHVNY